MSIRKLRSTGVILPRRTPTISGQIKNVRGVWRKCTRYTFMDKSFFADGIFASGRMSNRLKKKGIPYSKNSALTSTELARWNKMQGAGCVWKNCNAGYGESASSQTKVRIWQTKYVESQMNGLPLQFLRHISNRTKYDILLAKENFWKIENACEREEKVITLSAN